MTDSNATYSNRMVFMNKIVYVFLYLYVLTGSVTLAQVGIGTATPMVNSQLDVRSSTKGLLIPRLTTAQCATLKGLLTTENSIVNSGMQVFDTDLQKLYLWNATTNDWDEVSTGSASGPWTESGGFIFPNTLTHDVGIGINFPQSRLHVAVDDGNYDQAVSVARISHTTTGIAGVGIGAELAFDMENDAGTLKPAAQIYSTFTDVTDGNEFSDLHFGVTENGSMYSRMTLTPTGLGIGTFNPDFHVEARGSFNVALKAFNDDALQAAALHGSYTSHVEYSGDLSLTRQTDAFLVGNGSGTSQLFIEGSTGRVGIGTTVPDEALHLAAGTLRVQDLGGSGLQMATIDNDGNLGTAALPVALTAGSNVHNTLRWDGSNWVETSILTSGTTGTSGVGINTSPGSYAALDVFAPNDNTYFGIYTQHTENSAATLYSIANGQNSQAIVGASLPDAGEGIGVLGATSSIEPRSYGVCGLASDPGGEAIGVFGQSSSMGGSGNPSFGIRGEADSPESGTAGIIGFANSFSGEVYGVRGVSYSSDDYSAGVYGSAENGSSGRTYGVYGVTQGTDLEGAGVFGYAASTSGDVAGVRGESEAPGGSGVIGIANDAGAGVNYGVWGITYGEGTGAAGVTGNAFGSTGTTYGVYGSSASEDSDAAGVYGLATGTTGTNYGVIGTTFSAYDYSAGVFGYTTYGITYGVKGTTTSTDTDAAGVYGEAQDGLAVGVLGVNTSGAFGSAAVKGVKSGGSFEDYGVFGHNLSGIDKGAGVFGWTEAGGTFGVKGRTTSNDPASAGVKAEAYGDGPALWAEHDNTWGEGLGMFVRSSFGPGATTVHGARIESIAGSTSPNSLGLTINSNSVVNGGNQIGAEIGVSSPGGSSVVEGLSVSATASGVLATVRGLKVSVAGGNPANRTAAYFDGGNVGFNNIAPQATIHLNGNMIVTPNATPFNVGTPANYNLNVPANSGFYRITAGGAGTLATITFPTAPVLGQIFILMNTGAPVITVNEVGNILVSGGVTAALSQNGSITFVWNGNKWVEIARALNP